MPIWFTMSAAIAFLPARTAFVTSARFGHALRTSRHCLSTSTPLTVRVHRSSYT